MLDIETLKHLNETKAEEFIQILQEYREDLKKESDYYQDRIIKSGISYVDLFDRMNQDEGLRSYYWMTIKWSEACIVSDVLEMLTDPNRYEQMKREYLKEDK